MDTKTIRTEEIIVTNERDEPRVKIGKGEDGRYGFQLIDGKQRIAASCSATEEGTVVVHLSAGERARIVLIGSDQGQMDLQISGTAGPVASAQILDHAVVEAHDRRVLATVIDASWKPARAVLVTKDGLVPCDFEAERG